MKSCVTLLGLGILIVLQPGYSQGAQTPPPADQNARGQLIQYLDGIAQTDLDRRKEAIARIQNRAEAEQRKAMVREKILRLIGGLPKREGPVVVKEFGTVSGDGFRVEKIAYQSLPDFWVTADVYVPTSGDGPFPAVVVAPGHGAAGKQEDWSWGANLARNGIVALAYDPLGQGERLQYFDAKTNKSTVGNPTGEHGEANVQTMLIGDDVARYMVNDAMRAVDYLIKRKDVDADRIGAFGCSGGGTATAYFAALDDRVKVAATACYITSFQALLASPTGVQDAEQSIPHFIEQGLDFPDWVEAFAPKPYAIVSTTNDMFPFAGARQSFEEVKRFYSLYGAEDRIHWITGPGGHGHLQPIGGDIIGMFTKYLKGSSSPPTYTPMQLRDRQDIQCTPTGQVSTSLGGETVYSLNRKRAATLLPPERALSSKTDVARLRTRLRQDIRTLTGTVAQPDGTPPAVNVTGTEQREGYRLQTISFPTSGDMQVAGLLALPDASGKKAAVLMMAQSKEEAGAAGGELDRQAKAGHIVMMIEARPAPPGREGLKSPYLGIYNLLSLRAFLVGKTIVGLRMDDAIAALNWLRARKDVNASDITAYGSGPEGMVMLHVAAFDPHISRLVLDNTLTSYRMVVDQPLHRNISEVMIPGVLLKYDTGDLLLATYPHEVTITDPRDPLGAPVPGDEFRKALAYVFESGSKLGSPQRIRVTSGQPGESATPDTAAVH